MNRGTALLRTPRRFRAAGVIGASVLVVGLLAAASVPPRATTREEVFEIPPGTYAQRMAGKNIAILPATIHLTLDLQDVLLLRNRDEVPQTFGPVLIMPGQSFRLPFEKASTYHFACTAHADGQMTIVVHPPLTPGWATLQWRWRGLQRFLS